MVGTPRPTTMATHGLDPANIGSAPVANDMARNSFVGQREYLYPLSQRAATVWYHDHRMGYTGAAVWRGLAGFHLIHDDEEDALPLPRGERDIARQTLSVEPVPASTKLTKPRPFRDDMRQQDWPDEVGCK
jgi:FtsP/CotA-like multicopper oxidase with cupredoxin domain